jgi:4-hydroxy-L-threonine phosphate dehydrogenase PdxA
LTQATIALFTGDPAGIGAELVQKLLDQPALRPKASILLIGQQGAIRTTADVQWHPWSGIDAPGLASTNPFFHSAVRILQLLLRPNLRMVPPPSTLTILQCR